VLDIPAQEIEIGGHNRILVSIDTIHKPGSTTEKRGDAVGKPNPLQSYQFHDKELVHDVAFQVALADQIEEEASGGGAIGRVTNLLYNLENLRKREGDAQED
jgi:tRNA (guanine-N(7)-)-methyltransferase subunit TRM82